MKKPTDNEPLGMVNEHQPERARAETIAEPTCKVEAGEIPRHSSSAVSEAVASTRPVRESTTGKVKPMTEKEFMEEAWKARIHSHAVGEAPKPNPVLAEKQKRYRAIGKHEK